MFYYTIYEDVGAALDARDKIVGATRKDWRMRDTEAHQVPTGLIAPIDRPLTQGAEAVYGFVLHMEGPFARADEPDMGQARRSHGFAWVVY